VGRLYPGIQRASNETFGGKAPKTTKDGRSWLECDFARILQLFVHLPCPVSATHQTDMKNNIIYLRPEQNMQTTTDAGGWVRVEAERAFGLIDSLLILWLGGWSLYPGFACLQAAGLLVF
jgi:hypothetical protein